MSIHCSSCRTPYPDTGVPFRCPHCEGIFDFVSPPRFHPGQVEPDLTGIWPYRSTFGLPPGSPIISLGEGKTPLVWGKAGGRRVAFKLETQNPTGSFKDRGTAVLVSHLKQRAAQAAVEDSSGNAGASFAAYAARAGMAARVFVPAYASGPKREQIQHYGAEVIPVPGPRSAAARAVLEEARQGAVYASHAYLPHGLAGFATIAYELVSEMDPLARSLILPVGHGSLLLGVARGFKALQAAGMVEQLPRLIGVQAGACAPLVSAFQQGKTVPAEVDENDTLAEGIRIQNPYRGKEVLQAVRESGGSMVAVDEDDIQRGRDLLGEMGMYVEMTSAVVWGGLQQVVEDLPGPVVVILTGHGLKDR